MMNYNFNDLLSADEFELFCRDILSSEKNLDFRTFAPGGDRGIDIKYSFKNNDDDWIAQCKNIKSISMATIENEFNKVVKINPKQYFFMTTVELTDDWVEKIYNKYKKYMVSTKNIFGKKELNDILSKNPNIERKYYQLWIQSTNILEQFIYAEDNNRSQVFYSIIKNNLKQFIHINAYEDVHDILEKNHYCIIDGQPGIGKTTLASALALSYIKNKEYKFVYVSSINNIYKYLKDTQKIVFLFDDFLGGYFYEKDKLDEKAVEELIAIIRIIIKDQNKRIICTTRKNVLNKSKIENFKMKDRIFENTYNYSLKLLTLDEKMKIISNTVIKLIDNHELLELWDKYFIIKIAHNENFNIRLLVDAINITNSSTNINEYKNKIIKYFQNSELIWDEIFRDKLTYHAKILCYQLIFSKEIKSSFSNKTDINFENSYNHVYKMYCKKHNYSMTELAFKDAIFETKGFITNGNKEYLNFYHNSVHDYLVFYFNKNHNILEFCIEYNEIFSTPLTSYSLRKYSFGNENSSYKININSIKNYIFQKITNNIKDYTLKDCYALTSIGQFNQIFENEKSIITQIHKKLSEFNIKSFSSYNYSIVNHYFKTSKYFNYEEDADVDSYFEELISNTLETDYKNLDLIDLELFGELCTYYKIECDNDKIVAVIDYINPSVSEDLYDLESLVSDYRDISYYFNLDSTCVADEIKEVLENIYKNYSDEWEDSYEEIADELCDIFSIYLNI